MRYLRIAILAFGLCSCELNTVTLTEPDNLLVTEIYVQVSDQSPRGNAIAFIHNTLGATGNVQLAGADITLTSRGQSVRLTEFSDAEECLDVVALNNVSGKCFKEDELPLGFVIPGGVIEANVDAGQLGNFTGKTTIPGDFYFRVPGSETDRCFLEHSRALEIEWTSSMGAWAYVGETLIFGLPQALEVLNIDSEIESPLLLLGLSISSTDTTMVFPSEFGIFDRYSLDREVSVLLQDGIPENTWAEVFISAADRNYVNWVRESSFSPSGTARIPSLYGEGGTGVIASYIRRGFTLVTVRPSAEDSLVPCSGG